MLFVIALQEPVMLPSIFGFETKAVGFMIGFIPTT